MLQKPSSLEEEYIAKLEFAKKKKNEEEKAKKYAEEEKKRLKDLHYLHCPKCGHKLIEIEYLNTRIDKCSNCNGVFLDDGELDQILKFKKTTIKNLFSGFSK